MSVCDYCGVQGVVDCEKCQHDEWKKGIREALKRNEEAENRKQMNKEQHNEDMRKCMYCKHCQTSEYYHNLYVCDDSNCYVKLNGTCGKWAWFED